MDKQILNTEESCPLFQFLGYSTENHIHVFVLLYGNICSSMLSRRLFLPILIVSRWTIIRNVCGADHDYISLGQAEASLHRAMFKGYNRNVIPRVSVKDKIQIGVTLNIKSIEINENQGTIRLRVTRKLSWQDAFLKWDPNEFANITVVNVKTVQIWMPDVTVPNNGSDINIYSGQANVDYMGNIVIWPFTTLVIGCDFDTWRYPYDEQICEFRFNSWTLSFDHLQLNRSTAAIDLSYYVENGEWTLVLANATFSHYRYENEFFDALNYVLKVRRKPLYHIMFFLIPVFCTCVVNLGCFILPVESGERIQLSVSTVVSLFVLLSNLNSHLTESSDDVAAVSIFVELQLLGSVVVTVFSVVSTRNFFKKRTQPMSKRLLAKLNATCGLQRQIDGYFTVDFEQTNAENANMSGSLDCNGKESEENIEKAGIVCLEGESECADRGRRCFQNEVTASPVKKPLRKHFTRDDRDGRDELEEIKAFNNNCNQDDERPLLSFDKKCFVVTFIYQLVLFGGLFIVIFH